MSINGRILFGIPLVGLWCAVPEGKAQEAVDRHTSSKGRLIRLTLWCFCALLLTSPFVSAGQQPGGPTLASLATSPSGDTLTANTSFSLTLTGTGFDPEHARILFTGPGCNPCVVTNELLQVLRDKGNNVTGLKAVANVPAAGTFAISVQNGQGQDPVSATLMLTIHAATEKQGVSGSNANPITFNIEKEFCSYRSAYRYNAASQNGDTVSAIQGDPLVGVADPIPDLTKFVDSGRAILSATSRTPLQPNGSDASRLLVRAFGAGSCDEVDPAKTDTAKGKPNFKLLNTVYYVINVVRWQKAKTPAAPSTATGEQQPYQIASNDWYLFNTQDGSAERQKLIHGKFLPQVSTDTRIYGSNSVGFLAVHLRGDISQSDFEKLQISYDVTVKQATPINVQHLEQLISVITGVDLSGAKKAPAHATGAPPPEIVIGLYGGGQLSNISKIPDDITFAASIKFPQNSPLPPAVPTQPSPASFNNAYHNEGLQHWDVSVAVPVNSIKELNYSSTDGLVTDKEVSRYNAYGLFDLYPWAVDVSNPPAFAYPHLIFGLPFSGKVLNKPFVGAGGVLGFQSLPWIGKFLDKAIPVRLNFYGGLVYNKEFPPKSLKVGDPASSAAVANDLQGHRVWKGQFGIEFSIKDVANKLTGSSKGGSQSGSKGSS